jgi:hypothetical protein
MKLDGYDYFAIIGNEEEVEPWEYRENKVCVSALYPRCVAIKEDVQFWSIIISFNRQF